MRHRFLALPLILAACGSASGTGFDTYDTGSAGSSAVSRTATVPVYSVGAGLLAGQAKTTSIIMGAGLDQEPGVPFAAADVSGSLKLVDAKGKRYALVDRILPYGGTSRFTERDLADAITAEIERATQCKTADKPLVTRERGMILQLAVPVTCRV